MVQSKQETSSLLAGSELSSIRFCLAPQVTFSEQSHRGEIWVIIQNHLSNKQFSTTPLVREFVEMFRDGSTLVEALQRFASAETLPADQWLDLISKLMQADILSSPDINHDDHRLQQHIEQKSKTTKIKWSRPWMIKIPLGNPNALLTKISKKTLFLWTTPFFLLWLSFIVIGAFEAIDNLSALQYFWSTRFLDPNNIVLALIVYPILKFLHELGHGLAAKRWGADVLETGVLLILFVPLPYVDVSQSSFFPKKHQRMLVAAAGMMFELVIAVSALMVWLLTTNIFIQDICLNIILIGAVSSIFFNANPLLKFDGYYLLSDYLEIPNLSSRALQMCKYVLYRYVFNLRITAVANSLAEARWLLVYGIFSQIYRLSISFYIALYLGSQYFFIGVGLALWLILTQIIKPCWSGVKALLDEAKKQDVSQRIEATIATISAGFAIVIFMIPLQIDRTFSGVLMLDGAARVQSHASGFVEEILVAHDQSVVEGQALLHLRNPKTVSELLFLEAKIQENEVLVNQFRAEDPAQAAYYTDQVSAYRQEWKNLQQEQESMTIRSPMTGFFQKLSLDNVKGRYLAKGDNIGDVVSSKNMDVVLMLTEEEMRTFDRFQEAKVYMHAEQRDEYRVLSVQSTPGAMNRLPTPYLGARYGGDIPVDSSDNEGLKLLKPMFMVKVRIDTLDDKPLIGSRVHVKLSDEGKTLASVVYHKSLKVLRDRAIVD